MFLINVYSIGIANKVKLKNKIIIKNIFALVKIMFIAMLMIMLLKGIGIFSEECVCYAFD